MEFADQGLKSEDQVAVLCILSHGGHGFVYGVDGRTVPVTELLEYIDNISCKQMAMKPKIVVIQACQGSKLSNFNLNTQNLFLLSLSHK